MDFAFARDLQLQESVLHICSGAIALFGCICMLSACSLASTSRCEGSSDLRIQGIAAGSIGLTEQQARQAFETCRVSAIEAHRTVYMTAYREGIETYCTMRRGFGVGIEGYLYQDVCPQDKEEAFLTGYHAGSKLFVADFNLRTEKIGFANFASSSGGVQYRSSRGSGYKLPSAIVRCAAAKEQAEELGFDVDEVC